MFAIINIIISPIKTDIRDIKTDIVRVEKELKADIREIRTILLSLNTIIKSLKLKSNTPRFSHRSHHGIAEGTCNHDSINPKVS